MVHLKCKIQTSAQKDPKNKKSPEGRFNGILTVDFFEAQSNSERRFNECKIWPCQMIGWKECKRRSAPIKGGPSGFIELDCRENESNVRMVLPKTNVISLSEANEDNSGVSLHVEQILFSQENVFVMYLRNVYFIWICCNELHFSYSVLNE